MYVQVPRIELLRRRIDIRFADTFFQGWPLADNILPCTVQFQYHDSRNRCNAIAVSAHEISGRGYLNDLSVGQELASCTTED